MDVTLVSADVIKVKTKFTTFTIQTGSAFGISFESSPTKFSGPGEYEIKGIKITGLGKTDILGFTGKIDGLDICITKSSLAKRAKDLFGEYNLLLLEEDEAIDQAVFAALNANVAIIYGEKALDHIKALGKEIMPVSKYIITKEKLPNELEIVLLQ